MGSPSQFRVNSSVDVCLFVEYGPNIPIPQNKTPLSLLGVISNSVVLGSKNVQEKSAANFIQRVAKERQIN